MTLSDFTPSEQVMILAAAMATLRPMKHKSNQQKKLLADLESIYQRLTGA